MKGISDRLRNISILGAGALCFGAVWGVSRLFEGEVFCPFKAITGIPCPGCGGLRAFELLLHGRVWGALQLNPLSVLLVVFFAVSGVWLAVDAVCGNRTWLDFWGGNRPRWVVALAVAALILNWAWNICKGL